MPLQTRSLKRTFKKTATDESSLDAARPSPWRQKHDWCWIMHIFFWRRPVQRLALATFPR